MSPGPPLPSALPNAGKSSNPRKASPPRPGAEEAESTFKKKLEEVKRLRSQASAAPMAPTRERKKVIVNGKPSLAVSGDWALFASSSAGRQYYFNLKTLVNQWQRPPEWCDEDDPAGAISTPQPSIGQAAAARQPSEAQVPAAQPPLPPHHPGVANGNSDPGGSTGQSGSITGGPLFSMKMKSHKKRAKLKDGHALGEEPEQVTMTSIQPRDADATIQEPGSAKRARRSSSASSSSSHSSSRSSSSSSSRSKSKSRSRSPNVDTPKPDMSLVLAAKAKIEQHMAQVATQFLPASTRASNPTWLSEYNFPAVLSRCKFPKTYDAMHELNSNKGKKRNPVPLAESLEQAGREYKLAFIANEIKNSNNRNRLLSEKLGITVFKITDELWERYFPNFQIDLIDGVKLEARPHGYTEDDKPVYTRTGKVAQKMPFPEDIVRCHAVVQAWGTDTCHCVYANKTYTIQRDDGQWQKDLEECRKFLLDNGY